MTAKARRRSKDEGVKAASLLVSRPTISSNLPYLPPELTDNIFEHLLPTDKMYDGFASRKLMRASPLPHPLQDLQSCSLVCKDWRSLTIRYLFEDFTFKYYTRCDFPSSTTGRSRDTSNTIAEFLAFLKESPQVAGSIKSLAIVLEFTYYERDDESIDVAKHSPSPAQFYTLSQRLPHLRRLRLHNICLPIQQTSPKFIRDWYRGCFPELDSLKITVPSFGVRKYDPRQLLHVLEFFSTVQKLHIHKTQIVWEDTRKDVIFPPHLKIHTLRLENVKGPIARLLPPQAISDELIHFRSLELEARDLADMASLTKVVLASAKHLESFRCSMYGCITFLKNQYDCSLDFSSCTKLETLAIQFPIYPKEDPDYELNGCTWKAVMVLFLRAPPPNLKTLKLTIDQGDDRLDDVNFIHDQLNAIKVENKLIALCDATKLRIVHIDPLYDPPRFPLHLALADIQEDEEEAEADRYEKKKYARNWPPDQIVDRWRNDDYPMLLFPRLLFQGRLRIGGSNLLLPIAKIEEALKDPDSFSESQASLASCAESQRQEREREQKNRKVGERK